MRNVIFRTAAPVITALMIMFSIFVTLRGHNEPGGGFIGGLIAVSALAVFGLSNGVAAVRSAIYFHPLAIAGSGLLLAVLSGIISIFVGVPFMTGLWIYPSLLGLEVPLATVISFDIGVYLVVVGGISSTALALEERETD